MVILRGRRVLLRRGRPEDADRLFQIRNELEVARWWGADDIEGEISEQFIEADEGFVFEADGEVVGAIQYYKEDDPMYRHAGMDIFLTERSNAEWWDRHLLFRDYLRGNPEIAREYAHLKHELSHRFGEDREAYTDAKTEFILEVVRRAQENE
jgi:hypothetical protein